MNDSEYPPILCDPTFNAGGELAKYCLQMTYMIPALIVDAGFLVKNIYFDYFLVAQYLTIDFCNVCTPIVMIYMSSALRKVLFKSGDSKVVIVSASPSVASIRSKQITYAN
ncbi:unnamed protein product [Caenorhabditis auriculariae]|uniref:Serpentine receptor class gamma n=1 Tax=Caenorhabditis auriculariae TaxID=2777116 RepID=A0A8S1HT52_9PELO|nr:unnamed protein product [Caenorhabditis auriculariae]